MDVPLHVEWMDEIGNMGTVHRCTCTCTCIGTIVQLKIYFELD